MGDSKKKDILEGAAAVGAAAVALASGPIGVLAAALPTIVAMGFDAIKASDRRRATRLVERMIQSDESPAEFAAHLHEKLGTDEDVTAAFRILVTSSIESVSPSAIEPIALIGRRYLRGTCPVWIARGWLRILSELTTSEIEQLRALVHGADELRRRSVAEYRKIIGAEEFAIWSPRVRVRISDGSVGLRLIPDTKPSGVISVADLTRTGPSGPRDDQFEILYANDYAERLFADLQRQHLGWLDDSSSARDQQRRTQERERRRDEALARGETPRLRQELSTDSPTDFVFDEMSFDVLLEAFAETLGQGTGTS